MVLEPPYRFEDSELHVPQPDPGVDLGIEQPDHRPGYRIVVGAAATSTRWLDALVCQAPCALDREALAPPVSVMDEPLLPRLPT
jgi:hypothetical protein